MRFRGTLMASLVISALALSAVPALAADDRVDGSDEVAKAMERDLGLTPDQVKAQDEQQQRAVKLDEELRKSLGDAFAGSQYDLKSGRLIVMVSDRSLLEKASAAGADARLVSHPLRELDAIQAELDGGGVPGREATRARVAPFTGWYVDPINNAVHVTATRAQA